jgi:predicted MPP superfamily phosphohydrolase
MAVRRSLPHAVAQPLAWAIYIWMGTAFLLVVVLLASDLIRWFIGGAAYLWVRWMEGGAQPVEDPARRELLAKGVAGAATLTTTALSAVSVSSVLGEIDIKEVGVRLPRLPPELSGLSIVQLTDIHIGPTIGRKVLESVVEKANGAKPDAVVITGDLVDGRVSELRDKVEVLAQLRARYGVYFVTGNHEYYSGVDPWLTELRRLGIRVLRNERVALGDSARSIDLAGIDDAGAARFGNGHGPDLEKALAGRDPERELIVLAHQPKAIAEVSAMKAGLQLSGHTHGGQIFPFNAVVALVQPYVSGLHHHNELTQIYVSRGTGYWGPPMRLLAPAEVTKLVLAPG